MGLRLSDQRGGPDSNAESDYRLWKVIEFILTRLQRRFGVAEGRARADGNKDAWFSMLMGGFGGFCRRGGHEIIYNPPVPAGPCGMKVIVASHDYTILNRVWC